MVNYRGRGEISVEKNIEIRNNYRTAVMKSNRLHVICISRDIWMGVLIEKTSVTLE